MIVRRRHPRHGCRLGVGKALEYFDESVPIELIVQVVMLGEASFRYVVVEIYCDGDGKRV